MMKCCSSLEASTIVVVGKNTEKVAPGTELACVGGGVCTVVRSDSWRAT